MNLLVDYDDSDAEDTKQEEEPLPSTTSSAKPGQAILTSPLHLEEPSPSIHGGRSQTQPYKPPPGQTWPLGSHESLPVTTPVCSKRAQTPPAGLRPYVSKRQRLMTQPQALRDASSDPQATDLHLLSEVSERIRPYIGRKLGRTELPKRVQHHLSAHDGPVNTVQWCPVPHLSHLLLSVSMDKTVKVWDGAGSGRHLQTYSSHSGAVRDACWLPCGRRILSGSFDNAACVTDVETGQVITRVDNQCRVTCVAVQPSDPAVFLCGGFSPEVKAWDSRTRTMVRAYKATIQQTLDILFLADGKEFVTSSDAVSRDSADRTLIAWDFGTTARISNQMFHERYTCPSLALHPQEDTFAAQTNGNYIALFSARRPYRMNKTKRFEGHKVEGYAVQCELSPDGTVLSTGSSTGSVHFYDFHSSRNLFTLAAHQQACLNATFHPVLPALVATCDWAGEIKVWN
ncbi:WD repeat-containing protein 25 [Trichomycterus rosablanca]|uniref:WD repeat-containing protein 25 n=1 Tax=Trichomycterus rosablanca TaxID=2290929 RepID=UPI002F35CCBA